jgi:cobalt-precorrin 5A hydrolase
VRSLCADFKSAEAALSEAAEQLGKPLLILPLSELQAQSSAALTHSARVLQRFGVPSIAETAALAGAHAFSTRADSSHLHKGARLLCARQAFGAATCALATNEASP